MPWPATIVVDESDTARATVSPHGLVTGWSPGAQRLLGYRPTEIIGKPATRLLAAQPAAEALRAAQESPRWDGAVTLRGRDGRAHSVRVLAHRRGSGDSVAEWLLVSPLTDVSPTPEDDELVTLGFAQSPCTMALYDEHLRLRRLNADMERVLGLSEDAVRGLRLSEIVDHAESDRTEQCMRRVLETGRPEQTEASLHLPGHPRPSAWTVSLAPVRDGLGRLHGVLLSAHDMTEQQSARERLALLNEASVRIGSTLDLVRTAQELADVAVPRFADFVTIDLLPAIEGDQDPYTGTPLRPLLLRRTAYRSVLEGTPELVVHSGEVAAYPDTSAAAECLAAGRPLLQTVTPSGLAAWAGQTPARAERMRRFGFHSVLAVPIRARGMTLGVATYSRHQCPEPFGRDDALLAEEITGRAAVCIDNARRYARERRTSLALQSSLLPRGGFRQPAVEVASRYLPAGAQAGVGGDWFDVIPISGVRVALVVGDVVGHGLQASATMGRLRTAVRTLADVDLPPDELLTHLDDVVIRLSADADDETSTAGDVGATCLYAVYDPVSRRCNLARAGHPTPALVTPDGTVTLLDLPAGPPLGLSGLPFEAKEVDVPEGSLLVLYTNGLIEGRGRDIDEGAEKLRETLARPAASLEGTCDSVLQALLPECPDDDVALLIARTRALEASRVATWEISPDPASVAEARKHAGQQLAVWGLQEASFVTEMVVSELVTNAIRYAAPPILLRLIYDRSLICEVTDASNTTPHLRRARTFDEGGRGLLLVAQLTQAWGTRQTRAGKTIWTEQTLPAA
jgi:PAS domain S-box-containing protein